MKINRNSWHYRWYKFTYEKANPADFFERNEPRSLCGYFWGFIFSNLQLLFFTVLFTFLASLIPVLFWSWLHNHSYTAPRVLLAILGVVTAISLLVGVLALHHHLFKELPRRAKMKSYDGAPLTGTEIFAGYLKARKEKICPTIVYEGGKS